MKIRHAFIALAGLALAVPATAAAGDGLLDGAGKRVRNQPPARVRAPRVEAPRVRPPRVEAPRVRAPRVEPPRVRAPRVEAPRVRAPRVEAPRARPAGDGGILRDAGRRLNPPAARGESPPAFRANPGPAPGTGDSTRGQSVPRGGQGGGLLDRAGRGLGGRSDGGRDRTGTFGTPKNADSGTPGFTPASGGERGVRTGKSGLLGDVSRGLGGDRDRRTGGGGFVRGDGDRGGRADRSAPRVAPRPATWSDYRGGFRNGYRVGYSDGFHDSRWRYHDWYDRHHWYLSFSFGVSCGPYFGWSYHWPYRSWIHGCDYAFFYAAPITYCYVPYGFYYDATPYYVTRYAVVRETVPVVVYETSEVVTEEEADGAAKAGPAAPPEEGEVQVADPTPAAGSPATEKFLREASDHFRKKEYYEAAVQFRLAALASPELPGPLFALGQSLMAMGQDAYAARVIRRSVQMDPRLLDETGDISGVFESPAEYERVMADLETRAAAAPVDGDARFLLAAERYFAGDPRCREEFDRFHVARPEDEAVNVFRTAVDRRFKAPADLDLPVPEKPR